MTPELVRQIAASLKAGGYRTPKAYFSRARQEHLRVLLTPVPTAVDDAITMYSIAVERGIGPTVFKDAFVFEKLMGKIASPSLREVQALPAVACLATW